MTLRTRGLAGLAMVLAIGGAMAGIDVQDAVRSTARRIRGPAKRNRPDHIRKSRDKNKAASKARTKNKGR